MGPTGRGGLDTERWGGVIVAINTKPQRELSQWLQEAQKHTESSEKLVQSQLKRVVVHKFNHSDPERREFETVCRDAMVDCAPYIERAIELCELGSLVLASQPGRSNTERPLAALRDLASRMPAILEQVVCVERDLLFLGTGEISLGKSEPRAQVMQKQNEFRHQATKVGELTPAWLDGKIRALEVFTDALEQQLKGVRSWYQRDIELFKSALPLQESPSLGQSKWLRDVEARMLQRVEVVDRVLHGLQEVVCPGLKRIVRAFEQVPAGRSAPVS